MPPRPMESVPVHALHRCRRSRFVIAEKLYSTSKTEVDQTLLLSYERLSLIKEVWGQIK